MAKDCKIKADGFIFGSATLAVKCSLSVCFDYI